MGRSLYYLCPPCLITYTLYTLPRQATVKILSKNSCKIRLGPTKRHQKKEELCDGQVGRKETADCLGLDQLFTSRWCPGLRSESVFPHSSFYKCPSSDETFTSIIQRLKTKHLSSIFMAPQDTTGQTSLPWLPWLINCFTDQTDWLTYLPYFWNIYPVSVSLLVTKNLDPWIRHQHDLRYLFIFSPTYSVLWATLPSHC